jgi:Fe-S cluster biogenesis protein NfuA
MDDGQLTYDELLARIGALVEQVEQLPATDPPSPALELLDYLEAWHREGLTRLAMAMPPELLEAAREDPFVADLLDTYLSEDEDGDPTAIVEDALEQIRPYVHSHGGEMELLGVDHGIVTLELMGSCDGCPSSSLTLTQGVEAALRERWVGFRGLRVAGAAAPASAGHSHGQNLLQIQSLRPRS